MAEIKSTRLRFITTSSKQDLINIIDNLPFKVEIKGAPMKDGSKWTLWFVIPEQDGLKFESMDLT